MQHQYSDETFGYYMSDNFVTIVNTLSVKQAMRQLIREAATHDNIGTLFVTDVKGQYLGAMDIKQLIIAREDTVLASLIDPDFPYVYAEEEIWEKRGELKEFAEDDIAVLDALGRMVGVLESVDVLEIVEDELEEDYARLAGVPVEEEEQTSLWKSLMGRLPWLGILLVLGMGVSAIIGMFESVIQQLSAIVCFQSLILGMAGNTATQSLAVTIRLLSQDEMDGVRKRRLLFREFRLGLTGGMLLGILSMVFSAGYVWLILGDPFGFSVSVGVCVGLALWAAMTLSSCSGTLIPLCLDRFGIDPALAGGPLITTLGDLFSVAIYYGLAWLLLLQIL